MTGHAFAQVFDAPGRPLRYERIPLPSSLEEGEALLTVDLATICGSDLHTTGGRRRQPTPAVLGHEGVGRVAASEREGLEVGERVSWSIADSCGECRFCRGHQLPEKCLHLFKYGHADLDDGCGLNGAYATHLLLRPGTAAVPVPEGIPDALASTANCALSTAVNCVEQVPEGTASALVQGAGLLGIYACALLHERGLRVFCSDPLPARRDLAARFGAVGLDPALDPGQRRERVLEAAPDGVDAVLEMSGETPAVAAGMDLVRTGGTYVLAGMVHPDSDLAGITGERIVFKCLTIRGVHNYSPRHLRQGIEFLGRTAGRYPFEDLLGPTLPLRDLEEGLALSRQRRWLRVAVAPGLEG